MLAILCIASTAMAGRTAELKTTKALQTSAAKAIVKKEAKTGLVKNAKFAPMRESLAKLERSGGAKVVGMHKADATTTIEGTWTFDLGDFYFDSSVGYTTYDFEAFLDGDEVWFEDPTGWELPFVAKFDKEANTLTFVRENLGTLSGIYVYQQPYIFSWELFDIEYTESIVATYYPTEGVILFDEENGLAWEACGDEAGTEFYGWYSIYDLIGATYVGDPTPAEPIDEVQEGQWKSVGMATFVDAWIMPSYSIDGIQIDPNDYAYEVELQQNVENENVYRLWKPYANSILTEVNRSTYEGQIVFDISDPDHVMVLASGMPAGFKNNNGEFYLSNELGWYVNYGFEKDYVIDVLYEGAPADTYKDGVVTITTPMFDFSNKYEAGYSWNNNPYYAVITFPVETVGTYNMTIQPTTIAGEKTQPTVDIEIEVKKQGDNYWIAELGSTNYFNDQIIPFAYNDATKLATFTASYAGTFDEQHTWFSAFLNNGSSIIEVNQNYPVAFNATTGFEWTGNSGFGWFITETAEEFAPEEVYSAFYVLAPQYADASIEGEWDFTLDGHYLGAYSLGEFTETFNVTLDGNTVTFESTGSQYNVVGVFTSATTIEFNKTLVGSPESTYVLWQAPYVNTAGVEDLEELTEEVFTATYDAEAGTINFPANSGLRYGYFNAAGELSYWDDAFDFVNAKKANNDDPTAIESAKTVKAEVIYYDLNGRRINNPKAGIYVKKVGSDIQKVVIK